MQELTSLRYQLQLREHKLRCVEEAHRLAVNACTLADDSPRRGSVSGFFDLWMEVNTTALALEEAKRMVVGMKLRVVLCEKRYKQAFGGEGC